jgi:hypothetical protein
MSEQNNQPQTAVGKGKWGDRRDSNPRQPESQSGALPLNYDHHTAEAETSLKACRLKIPAESLRAFWPQKRILKENFSFPSSDHIVGKP